jgi:hypothetical protein
MRLVTTTQHRTRRAVADLHHVLPTEDQELASPRPVHVWRPGPHPSRVRGGAILIVLAVLVSSSTFWAFLWWDDAVRQDFFPRRGPGTLVMSALFGWGCLTQIVGPLRLTHGLQMSGRLLISLSLKLVVCWTATGLLTLAWWLVADDISGWFALLAAMLLPPAWTLFQLVRVAVKADSGLLPVQRGAERREDGA